jgi:hypothetical protein
MRFLLLVLLGACLFALFAPTSAWAIDRTFSGSAQEDYFFVPTEKNNDARSNGFDGFTTEASLKVAVDITDRFSANVKTCFGCHGFEIDMAYVDYRVADELDFQMGRFSPSFGSFNVRHDPANHALSDKPLPYDMGRMLRYTTWNLGVLPSPFPDNGAQITGTHWFGDNTQLNYALYAVSGFKSTTDDSSDINFIQSRTPALYYVDNNSRPSVGGRVSATQRFSRDSDLTVGASAMGGTYDPDNHLSYTIVGGDAVLRVKRTTIRMEYLTRRTEFDISDPTQYKYAIPSSRSNFFVKQGAYIEAERPVSPVVTLVGRVDGLYRVGNVPVGTDLSFRSSVVRYTGGAMFTIDRGLRLKTSAEVWQFSDKGVDGNSVDVGFHVAAVGSF